MSGSPSPSRLLAERWGVPLLLIPLYLWGLWRWPLWDAEMWTVRAAAQPFAEMLKTVAEDKHPPLFFILEWLLFRIHPSYMVARVPPAIAALLAVIAAQQVAIRHFGRRTGWFTALLFGMSPFMASYAANARSGTTTIFLGILALGFGLDLVTGPQPRKSALALGLVTLTGLYVHYAMALTTVGMALGGGLAGISRKMEQRGQRLGLGVVALLLPTLAFLPWALGPMSQQHLDEKPAARTWLVLRYLWWPIGPEHILPGATLLLGLAIFGLARMLWRVDPRRAVFAGWAITAVVVPYLWSTIPSVPGKFYLFAPLLGMFLMLAAYALATLTKMLERRLPEGWAIGTVSLAVVGGGVLPLYYTLNVTSNLVSIAPLTPGIYDPRLEARVLRTTEVGHPIALFTGTRAAEDLLYYVPELDPKEGRPGDPPRPAWIATPRTEDRVETERQLKESAPGCLFTEAFSFYLKVPHPEECSALLRHITEVAERDLYGPFLLELATEAWRDRNVKRVEQYARLAAEQDAVSAKGDVLLVRVLVETRQHEAALVAADAGMKKAARYLQRQEWKDLAELRLQAAKALRNGPEVHATEQTLLCLKERLYHPDEGWCNGGILGLL